MFELNNWIEMVNSSLLKPNPVIGQWADNIAMWNPIIDSVVASSKMWEVNPLSAGVAAISSSLVLNSPLESIAGNTLAGQWAANNPLLKPNPVIGQWADNAAMWNPIIDSVVASSKMWEVNPLLEGMVAFSSPLVLNSSIESIAANTLAWSSKLTFEITNKLNTYISNVPILTYDFSLLRDKVKKYLLKAFNYIGLCLAPSMSDELMYKVGALVEDGFFVPAQLSVWNYYSRNDHACLRSTVNSWKNDPQFASRWQYITDALDAHVQKRYGSSVRTLAPDVEGIASDFVYKNTLKPQPTSTKLGLGKPEAIIKRFLEKAGDITNLNNNSDDMRHWVSYYSIYSYIDDVFCEEFDFEMYYNVWRNRKKPNRHGIAHGIQIAAGTAMNSLRLFLLLDTMYYLRQSYKSTGGLI